MTFQYASHLERELRSIIGRLDENPDVDAGRERERLKGIALGLARVALRAPRAFDHKHYFARAGALLQVNAEGA